MNDRTRSRQAVRADLIEEARALLRIIDAEHSSEDFNEGPEARETRLMLPAMARQLVAKMIEELQGPLRSSLAKFTASDTSDELDAGEGVTQLFRS